MGRFGIIKMSNVSQFNSGVTKIKTKTPTTFLEPSKNYVSEYKDIVNKEGRIEH